MTETLTDCISRHSVTQIINAFAFAEQTNTPFTAYVIIAWGKTDDWSPARLPERQEEFARRLRKWFDRHGLPAAYVYTVEEGGTVGLHMNLAVHVPRKLFSQFVFAFPSFVPGFSGNPCTVRFKSDRGKTEPKFYFHPNQRVGSLRYMLKGIDPDAAFNAAGGRVRLCDHLGIRPSPQGTVVGRRTGVSHALGKEARAR